VLQCLRSSSQFTFIGGVRTGNARALDDEKLTNLHWQRWRIRFASVITSEGGGLVEPVVYVVNLKRRSEPYPSEAGS
jgi:hypothetical protein